jgi:hypothetical protein
MKHVCLDIGNVLCRVDFTNFLRHLSKALNITLDDGMYFLNRSQKLHDLGLTVMKDELKDHFKIKSPVIVEEILDSWNKSITIDIEVLDFFNELIDRKDIEVALLSNIGLEHAELMKNILNHGRFYDSSVKHFSCFVGARKPSLVYYQSFLMQYPQFKGALYIDDLQENLDSSKKFGFETHLFSIDASTATGCKDVCLQDIKSLILAP